MKGVLVTFLAVALLGCQAPSATRHVDGPGALNVGAVDVARAINRDVASELALSYFAEFHGSCGDVRYSSYDIDGWRFHTFVGFACTPGEDIVVSRDGARIEQKGCPDVLFRNGAWQYRGRNFYGDDFSG